MDFLIRKRISSKTLVVNEKLHQYLTNRKKVCLVDKTGFQYARNYTKPSRMMATEILTIFWNPHTLIIFIHRYKAKINTSKLSKSGYPTK